MRVIMFDSVLEQPELFDPGGREEAMGQDVGTRPSADPPTLGSAGSAGPARGSAGPSRRQVLRRASAGLGAAALAPVLGMTGRTAGAEAAPITDAGSRSVAFGEAWKFALVNPDGITDPTGAYANAADPGYDDSHW